MQSFLLPWRVRDKRFNFQQAPVRVLARRVASPLTSHPLVFRRWHARAQGVVSRGKMDERGEGEERNGDTGGYGRNKRLSEGVKWADRKQIESIIAILSFSLFFFFHNNVDSNNDKTRMWRNAKTRMKISKRHQVTINNNLRGQRFRKKKKIKKWWWKFIYKREE